MSDESPEQPEKLEFVPSEFMKGRHPDLFPDSEMVEEPAVTRAVFEYHLETLTARRQETEFETFCRKLAQRELCPNLRPQTGAVGGGDSKVDAENVPVAQELAERWFEGDIAAANERWAFAFSAMKNWKAKVKSDVEKIVGTERPYKRIYFITNQFARDKDRAALEDTLSASAKVPVVILDRNWIVDRIFESGRFELLPSIGIEVPQHASKRAGSMDVARTAELEELDAQIDDPDRYKGIPYALAEDCLQTAILARSLGRPRQEVEGRFARAQRVAENANSAKQKLRIAYAQAWTAFWWFNDAREMNRLYDEVESFALPSADTSDLEFVVNLYQLLWPTVLRGQLDAQAAQVDVRSARLHSALERVAADGSRPNNALLAKTELLLVRISEAARDRKPELLDPLWTELGQITKDAERHGEFPVEMLYRLVKEMGVLFTDSAAFDAVFEEVVALYERRRSQAEAGVAYVERAYQKFKAGRFVETIRLLGRAVDRLAKDEYRAQLITALALLSAAYEKVGLHWAARTAALGAAERSLLPFRQTGTLLRPAPLALRRLMQTELRLGRVPQFLAASEIESAVRANVELEGEASANAARAADEIDRLFGLLLLRTPFEMLPQLDRLPDRLAVMELDFAHFALLFALGYEPELRESGTIPATEPPDGVQEFFQSWFSHPAGADIASAPLLGNDDQVVLASNVLGCELSFDVSNTPASIGLAEAVLGALEAFLATSLNSDVLPFMEHLDVRIRSSEDYEGPPSLEVVRTGGVARVEIVHRSDMRFGSSEALLQFSDWLINAVITLMTTFTVSFNAEEWLGKIAGKEKGLSRAISFSNTLIMNTNLFGDTPRLRTSEWLGESAYPRRGKAPQPALVPEPAAITDEKQPVFGEGEPPPELSDEDWVKHEERRVASVIDLPLWDKAGWKGAGFLYALDGDEPPLFALLFQNPSAAEDIIDGWISRFGTVDAEEEIRIAIVRGISAARPNEYGIVIGAKIAPPSGTKTFLFVQRIHRVDPSNTENLEGFLKRYAATGRYQLTAALLRAQGEPLFLNRQIEKSDLVVRQAWQISENDPDMSVLDPDDPPMIPPMVTNPPVTKALARLRRSGRKD